MSKDMRDGQTLKGSKTNIFKMCFKQVRILPGYQGQWIIKGRWLEIVNERCKKSLGSMELAIAHTRIYVNSDFIPNIVNKHNLYKTSRYGDQTAFCSTRPGKAPPKPGGRDGWGQLFTNKGENTQRRITRTNHLDVAMVSP
jgi:hypothetical protein